MTRTWMSWSATALLAMTFAHPAGAASPPPPETITIRARLDFPSVGLVTGQTIRVSVVSTRPTGSSESSILPPDRVRILLVDADGERVADSGPLALPPGPTRVFDVSRAQLAGAGDAGTGRVQVRAVVLLTGGSALPIDPCRSTVEVFSSSTGRTVTALASPGQTRAD